MSNAEKITHPGVPKWLSRTQDTATKCFLCGASLLAFKVAASVPKSRRDRQWSREEGSAADPWWANQREGLKQKTKKSEIESAYLGEYFQDVELYAAHFLTGKFWKVLVHSTEDFVQKPVFV